MYTREAIVNAQFSARGGIALTVSAEYPDKTGNKKIAAMADEVVTLVPFALFVRLSLSWKGRGLRWV